MNPSYRFIFIEVGIITSNSSVTQCIVPKIKAIFDFDFQYRLFIWTTADVKPDVTFIFHSNYPWMAIDENELADKCKD